MWRCLNDQYEDRTYFIKIEEDEDLELPYYATSVSRYTKNGNLYAVWANSAKESWEGKCVPVSLLKPGNSAEQNLKQWAKDASDGDVDKLLLINDIGNKLRNKFFSFNLPFLSLPPSTKPEVALNVFIQMNTSSSPLTPFDIVVAQIEAATAKSLHGYIDELKSELPKISRYNAPEDTVLAVAALLQEKLPSKGTYLSTDFSTSFEGKWESIKHGIKKAVAFLSDERLYDSRRLPSDVVVYVIGAIWANAPEGLDKEGEIRVLLRKYIWRAFFTDRYGRTTNSRAFSDYKELRKLVLGENGVPEVFDEEVHPLATTEELSTAGWPYRKDRLARAILAVSLRTGGFDFADGSPASYDNIQAREYHHVFPKAWLEKKERKDYEINRAMNCALISWRTNRNISDKEPSEYIFERMEQNSLGNEEVKRRLESHSIPTKELQENDYDSFIRKRAELIRQLSEKLCNGQIVEGML